MLPQFHDIFSQDASSSHYTFIADDIDSFPYPPPILVKHPTWFRDDADLFLSHNELLFGLNQAQFQSPYFSNILQTIEPGHTTARGSVPSLPIPCNDISRTILHSFIVLRYYPETFTTSRDGWVTLRSLALKWRFNDVITRSLSELRHFDQRRFAPHQRQLLDHNGPHFVNNMFLQRWKNSHLRVTAADYDDENWEFSV
jgi:hypothetical protein